MPDIQRRRPDDMDTVPLMPRSMFDRAARHEIARIDAATSVELAHIDAVAEVQQDKIRAMNGIGTTAMMATAHLSQAEAALTQIAPHASARISGIADITAVMTTEIVVDSGREIRRGRR